MSSRKGVGKAMLGRVLKEAMDRDIHNVFTFVRVDNKVHTRDTPVVALLI